MQIGHRGLPSQYPENTRISFKKAIEENFNGIELDVHLSKDEELIIIHDETLNRTTDSRGNVKDFTLEELRKVKIGFNECNGDDDCYSETIMTLEEFFIEFGNDLKIINIEVKNDIYDYPGIEEKIIKLINNYKHLKEKIILSSFNFFSLLKLNKLNKEIKLGFLIWSGKTLKEVGNNIIKETCQYLIPSYTFYEKNKNELIKLNMDFMVYTINNKDQYSKMNNDSNIKHIITNHKF